MKVQAIGEEDLPGTMVMASCVVQLELLTHEFKRALEATNRMIDEQYEVLKAFGDLYIELTSAAADRKWIRDRIKRAERERARLRVPIWFWRDDEPLRAALLHRAAWMREEGYLEDDIFDLLAEYCAHTGKSASEKQIAKIVRFTRPREGDDHADAT